MKKRLIVLLMFLLSCMAIYSDDINSQSESNSFSSKNFLKKLNSLTTKNPEKTEKFANYLKDEMERKKEVTYFIKVNRDENKITILAENEEVLFDEVVSKEVINSFPTDQTKIREVEQKGLIKTYLEASYMVKEPKKQKSQNGKMEKVKEVEKTELTKLENNIKLLLKSYDVLNSSIASIYAARDKMVSVQQYRDRTMTITGEEDGQKIKIVYNFDNTFLGGAMKIFVDDVLISQSKIKNLLPDGEIKLFHPNGKVSGTATATEGKLNGVAKLLDENGDTIEEVIYKNNKVVKRIK
ncbi:hypothetical protein [Fusobacterium hwasookii]|uniref:toxin-antitoxin system YwqK family antitoxin n=1 Tax=Fusobacterium hwasookii TaxID=1583098 RepID=UPI0028E89E96|nr:hypothetical protein [Fusobacterium hwasookii]